MEISQTALHPLKTKMQAGQAALGLSLRMIRTPDAARLARNTCHNFLFIDVPSAIFNLESIFAIAQTALAIGIAPLVRVRSIDDPDVPVLLDNGITGMVFPNVNTPQQAKHAVDRCRFPPIGRRSVAGGYVHFEYCAMPVAKATAALEAHTLVVFMVETAEEFANLEAIAAVPGAHVVHIGANDLIVSLGKAGQFGDPIVVEAMDRSIAASAPYGGFAGYDANRDLPQQAASIKRGVQFLTTHTDIGFLSAAASQWTAGLHAALKG